MKIYSKFIFSRICWTRSRSNSRK